MNLIQQVAVIILACVFSIYVLRETRTARLDLRHAIPWLMVVVGVLFIAVFPNSVLYIASVLGFAAGTNLLFIVAIAILSVIVFRQTMLLSELERKLITLTQTIALLQYELDNQQIARPTQSNNTQSSTIPQVSSVFLEKSPDF